MSDIDRVILAGGPGERRLALMRQDRVVEFAIDRFRPAAGDILLGRLLTRPNGLDAAFVEIGDSLPGFLRHPGKTAEGAPILVQVLSAARRDKGASLSAAPQLAGRLLVYGGRQKGVSLSKKIDAAADRGRLTALLAPMLQPHEAVTLRAAAQTADGAAVTDELASLRARWQDVRQRAATATPPARLLAPGALAQLLDTETRSPTLEVDAPWLLPEARRLHPAAQLRPGCWQDSGAADAFEAALAPTVPLAGGGRLVIDETTAVTAIDIDGGGQSAAAANAAALPEIARQLRLRGLAGQIVIDAIDQGGAAANRALVERLRALTAADPTPTQILGMTRLGLIEVTRERRRPSLAELFLTPLQAERSTESLALEGLQSALTMVQHRPSTAPLLLAAPAVIHFLERHPELLAETARHLGRPLRWRSETGMQSVAIVEDRS